MNRETKNSSIPWIGAIPSGWTILRIKNTSWLKGRIGWDGLKSEEFQETGPYIITGTDFVDGQVNWDSCAHITQERFAEDELLHIFEGDLLITKDGTIGKLAMVQNCPDNVSLNSGVMIIRNNSAWKYDQKFMYYMLGSDVFTQWFECEQKPGSTIKHLYQNQFTEFQFPMPPLPEQHAIVRYLDTKCAAIDEAIDRHKRIIEKLEEYRTSFATMVLTQGTNRDVRLIDSGVQQIGEIPEHWTVVRIKHLLSTDRVNLRVGPFGSALSTKEYTDEGPWVYTQRTVLDDNFKENPIHISEEKYTSLEGFSVIDGDLLVTTRGTIGKLAIVPDDAPKGILHPCLIKFRVDKNKIHHEILKHLFNDTDLVMNQIRKQAEGATIEALYSGPLKDVYVPLPPYTEQVEILNFLDSQSQNINNMIKNHQTIVAKLEEYRKSIIYYAVTGKIDCREMTT